ncbi:hypothetical protein [Vibrio algicola]|uniref:Lipoprotein n=1 Tax=Vibrio algicola TaxID=2662262 RepID=A0A5Q0TI80_9VIBR|nr:hypothetical protein [Vibrio algicola]
MKKLVVLAVLTATAVLTGCSAPAPYYASGVMVSNFGEEFTKSIKDKPFQGYGVATGGHAELNDSVLVMFINMDEGKTPLSEKDTQGFAVNSCANIANSGYARKLHGAIDRATNVTAFAIDVTVSRERDPKQLHGYSVCYTQKSATNKQ